MRYAFGPCISCEQYFGYDPHRVASTSAVTGKREPLCRSCVVYANQQRRAQGADPIEISEDAYGPHREEMP